MYICRFLRVQLLSEWNHCNEHCWCVVHLYQLIVTWLDITLQRVSEMYLCFSTYVFFRISMHFLGVSMFAVQITVFRVGEATQDIDLAILAALLKSMYNVCRLTIWYDTIYLPSYSLLSVSLCVSVCVCVCLCRFIRWTLWQNVRPSVGCWLRRVSLSASHLLSLLKLLFLSADAICYSNLFFFLDHN